MKKCLIVGFDGLRQDSITDELMPNLRNFIDGGCLCQAHRAVFPTETYVNHPSIFTGAFPKNHGLIANFYYNRPGLSDEIFFDGSSVESITGNDKQGLLFGVPTLGQYLGAAGLSMRVIGSNSSGSTRLKHHTAGRYPNHLALPVRDVSKVSPAKELAAWRTIHGAGHPLNLPDEAGSRAVVESFFKVEAPKGLADLTVLWLGEPDHSCHRDGPTGPRTLAALSQADALFGTILDWRRAEGSRVQLLALSDHGHVVVDRHSDVKGTLVEAGLRVFSPLDLKNGADINEADLIMAGEYCGGLWSARPGDMKTVKRAADVLQQSQDIGLLFSSRPELTADRRSGLFAEALVLTDHERAPDLRFITRGDPLSGRTAAESGLPIGGGAHGGLLPQELFCLCAWGGDAFKRETVNMLPSGPADIAATILRLMDFNPAMIARLDGRALSECFVNQPPATEAAPKTEVLTAERNGFKQILRRTGYNNRIYLDQGCRES
ncbi:MAG: alkaline phosphatase family protein [Candidatus Adiutrix sp.]|nr:alkaline phosphatase family protein [Candidatus Adiutrix sp.]